MKYKFIIIITLFSLNLSASQNEKLYNKSIAKWNKSNIKEYYIKVEFSAFSPLSGIWDLKVKEGKIFQCSFNGKNAENYKKTAEMFTMENLYKTAGECVNCSKDSPFLIETTYDKNQFIKSLAKIRNPEYKNKVKTDSFFKIEVLDFIPAGR